MANEVTGIEGIASHFGTCEDDFIRAPKDLRIEDSQYRRRNLLRALSSFLESSVDMYWSLLYRFYAKHPALTQADRSILRKFAYRLKENGDIGARRQIYPLVPRFKFVLNMRKFRQGREGEAD